jgi:hypothetical protein
MGVFGAIKALQWGFNCSFFHFRGGWFTACPPGGLSRNRLGWRTEKQKKILAISIVRLLGLIARKFGEEF